MHGITNIFTKDENAIHNTEMRILENDLIPVYETNSGEKVVYGTELHAGLGSPSVYREWAKRRLSDVDAVENEDYTTVEIPTVSGGLPRKDHIIKLDTAKEMAMLERNEKGKQVRRYFIRVEKKYKEHIQDSLSWLTTTAAISPFSTTSCLWMNTISPSCILAFIMLSPFAFKQKSAFTSVPAST